MDAIAVAVYAGGGSDHSFQRSSSVQLSKAMAMYCGGLLTAKAGAAASAKIDAAKDLKNVRNGSTRE